MTRVRDPKDRVHLQVWVALEAASGVAKMASRQQLSTSDFMEQVIESMVDADRLAEKRQQMMEELAREMTPWLHEELRARGVKDPERYQVGFE